jgi:hypothetical protein
MKTAEKIQEEVSKLPEPLAREVLDFIGYLEYRHGLRDNSDIEELKTAQESSMHNVWDNSEDEVWNDVPTR